MPKELLRQDLRDGAERIGRNIKEAGEPAKRDEQAGNPSDYGVNKAETAAGAMAQAAYTQGRKLAEKKLAQKKEQLKGNIQAREVIQEQIHAIEPEIEPEATLPGEADHYRTAEHRNFAETDIKQREQTAMTCFNSEENIKTRTAGDSIREKETVGSAQTEGKAARQKGIYKGARHLTVQEQGLTPKIEDKTSGEALPGNVSSEVKIKEVDRGRIKTKVTEPCIVNTDNNSGYANQGGNRQGIAESRDVDTAADIKTREAYRLAETASDENPSGQAVDKLKLKRGRKLAEKNMARDRQAVQILETSGYEINNGEAVTDELLGSSNKTFVENSTPTVWNEKALSNSKQVNNFAQDFVNQQHSKAGKIKTKEYIRQQEKPGGGVNSVRERSVRPPVLFGKGVAGDVKSNGGKEEKAAAKGSLTGVLVSAQSRQKNLWVRQVRCAASNRALNNNGFRYISTNGKTARLEQILRRLVPKNGKEMLAGIMGLGSSLAVVIIICLMGALFASPFGIFFSGADTMSEAVSELNTEFSQRIEQIKAGNSYDELQFSNAGSGMMAANWPDVLAVYTVLTTMDDSNPYEAITLDEAKKARLREVFWAMNQISYGMRTEYREEMDAEIEVLYISVAEKDCWQMVDEYAFTSEQRQMLAELKKPEYREMFMALAGSFQDIALTPEEIEAVIANLPADLSEERRQVVLTAYQLEGKVGYFWGGKSLVLGWDSRWGTPQEVWAAGSVTSGTVRPFGLDCSGFVDWVFYNASGGSFVAGRGGGAASQHSYCQPVSWAEARPGDLAFYSDDSHVGIICGFDSRGNVQIIHCAAGYNNVVVTGKSGFAAVGRPDYFDD